MPQLKSCPIEATFKIIGKKWKVLIIREMPSGIAQFNRFLENIKGRRPRVLTELLRKLKILGIVRRRLYQRLRSECSTVL
jgi:DNA-binding HxlR family transcriptional regulator